MERPPVGWRQPAISQNRSVRKTERKRARQRERERVHTHLGASLCGLAREHSARPLVSRTVCGPLSVCLFVSLSLAIAYTRSPPPSPSFSLFHPHSLSRSMPPSRTLAHPLERPSVGWRVSTVRGPLCRACILSCLFHLRSSGGPASRHGRLNSRFQVALHLPPQHPTPAARNPRAGARNPRQGAGGAW